MCTIWPLVEPFPHYMRHCHQLWRSGQTRKEPRKRTRILHQPTASQPLRFSRIRLASQLLNGLCPGSETAAIRRGETSNSRSAPEKHSLEHLGKALYKRHRRWVWPWFDQIVLSKSDHQQPLRILEPLRCRNSPIFYVLLHRPPHTIMLGTEK